MTPMRRALPLLLLLAAAACVTPEPVPDGRGAVAPGQRMVVAVYVAPGPWIVSDPDSKAESAAKLLPIGMLMQTMQEDRVLEISKELQPYLPRPRFDRAFEAAFTQELAALHDGKVQSWTQAELPPEAKREFNRSDDQLDWRRKYLHPRGAPRDYSRFLTLDDAVVVDVNLQFGTDVSDEEGRLLPTLTAATRVYRPGTTKLLFSRIDVASDQASTHTLTEFRAEPKALTDRLEALVPVLAKKAATELSQALRLTPSAPAAAPEAAPPLLPGGSITAAPAEPAPAPRALALPAAAPPEPAAAPPAAEPAQPAPEPPPAQPADAAPVPAAVETSTSPAQP